MQIGLIALDLDGTALLEDHRSVSGRLKRAVSAAAAKGIPVAVATGRIYSFVPPAVVSIPEIDWAVTSNGAVLYSMKERRAAGGTYISPEDAAWVLRLVPPDTWAELWSRGKLYIEREKWRRAEEYPIQPLHRAALGSLRAEAEDLFSLLESGGLDVEKIHILLPPSGGDEILERLAGRRRYDVVREGRGVEIMGAGVSKAEGLRRLCRRLPGVGMADILAIGDSDNDVEMLRECGFGVAMGNAAESVKAAADAVTLGNSEDGAALAIERYAL